MKCTGLELASASAWVLLPRPPCSHAYYCVANPLLPLIKPLKCFANHHVI